MQNKNRGFTLIELLVVIAIIGILAAIVLASLNSARNRGKNASAQGSLSSVRAAFELFYNKNSLSYGNTTAVGIPNGVQFTSSSTGSANATEACGNDEVVKLLAAAAKQTGQNSSCNAQGQKYVALTQLINVSGAANTFYFFCVDSTGFAGERVMSTTPGSFDPTTALSSLVCQ